MSAKPAKPISSIAHCGISGTVADCVTLMLTTKPPSGGSEGGSGFRLPPGFTKADTGANEPTTTGSVTSQHAGGKVPWITPDGQVMAKLFCAAIISRPRICFALEYAPPKGGFEPGKS